MRKGTKRKSTHKHEPKRKPAEEDQTNSEEPSRNAEPEPEPEPVKEAAGKGAKVAKPEEEPEYFPEKRNLEDLWLQVFPFGTESDLLDTVYRYKWNFSNLEEALEEGGELHNKKVYLFGAAEPGFVPYKDQKVYVWVPVVVVVVSPFPPSDKVGIIQNKTEEIVPMKQMKMDWVPYIPPENRESEVGRLKDSQIFILSCNERWDGQTHLVTDRDLLKQYGNCYPYFYNPLPEQSTEVELLFPIDTKPPVSCKFDWELDKIEEFTNELIENEELPGDQKRPFKNYVMKKIREAKKANLERWGSGKKARDELDRQSKVAFKNMKFYKFFPVPTPDTPDVSSIKKQAASAGTSQKENMATSAGTEFPLINRYYGKAHMVI